MIKKATTEEQRIKRLLDLILKDEESDGWASPADWSVDLPFGGLHLQVYCGNSGLDYPACINISINVTDPSAQISGERTLGETCILLTRDQTNYFVKKWNNLHPEARFPYEKEGN